MATYLLIDGENLDATLGVQILGRRPAPEERPRWDRVAQFAHQVWGQTAKSLFFMRGTAGNLPMPFIQALMALGVRPVLLSGPTEVKVVDIGIQRTLEAIAGHGGDVLLATHDADFEPQVRALLVAGRRVGLLCYREYLSTQYLDPSLAALEIFDLEDDVRCFNQPLPRLRVIDIDEFDPITLL